MSENGEHDRITPYDDTCTIKERIDEIVASGTDVHVEMMDSGTAWMRVGLEIFWLHAAKGKLVIRHSETWPPFEEEPSALTEGERT